MKPRLHRPDHPAEALRGARPAGSHREQGGAGGIIGAEYASKQPADGYTIFLATADAGDLPGRVREAPYDPIRISPGRHDSTMRSSRYCIPRRRSSRWRRSSRTPRRSSKSQPRRRQRIASAPRPSCRGAGEQRPARRAVQGSCPSVPTFSAPASAGRAPSVTITHVGEARPPHYRGCALPAARVPTFRKSACRRRAAGGVAVPAGTSPEVVATATLAAIACRTSASSPRMDSTACSSPWSFARAASRCRSGSASPRVQTSKWSNREAWSPTSSR